MTPAIVTVAVAAAAIVERELDLLLEPLDAILDVASLARIEPAAGALAQPAVDLVGLVEQALGTSAADHVPAVKAADLALDIVDPRLKRPNLAPIASETIVIAIIVAVVVAVRRGLRLRIILCRGGAGGDEGRSCGGN